MRVIEMTIEDLQQDGVFAISLVENPAIEEDFIYLSKEELQLKVTEQGLVVGLALVPNKKIDRLDKQGNKYQIFFTEETIKQTAHLFLSRQQNNNATLEHEKPTNGVSFVESWIVEDENNDKLNLYGIKPIKGAWGVVGKITDDRIKEQIKQGTYKGFSIEGKYEPKLTKEQIVENLKSLINGWENKK